MEKINYWPINWMDGMKISKQEFISMEDCLLDQIRDANAVALTDYNFGLLPAPEAGREALSVDVSPERVEVYHCRAVTRAGARIEMIDRSDNVLRESVRKLMGDFDPSHAQEWYVMLRVNLFKRVPYGQPAPDGKRLLNTVPSYELAIVPREQANSPKIAAFALPIAKIRGAVGGIEQVKNYIPPCSRLDSSPELRRFQQRLEQDLSFILKEATIIVRKVNYRRSKETTNPLADDISQIAAQVMGFLNNNYDAYRLLLPSQPPLMLVEYFARFARTVDTALEVTGDKDGVLNYFQQYVQQFKYADFNAAIQAMTSSLTYNHLELRESLDKVSRFVEQMRNLLEGLSRLDYKQLPRYDSIIHTQIHNSQQPPQQPYHTPHHLQTDNTTQSKSVGKVIIKGKEREEPSRDPNNPFGLAQD